MDIGDKIRLVRDKEEGVIRRKLNNNVFEVELSDGFDIQVHFSEIILVEKSKTSEKDTQTINKAVEPEPLPASENTIKGGQQKSDLKYVDDCFFALEVIKNDCFTYVFNKTSKLLQLAMEVEIGGELIPYGAFQIKAGTYLKTKTLKKDFLTKNVLVKLYMTLFDEKQGVERLAERRHKLDMPLIMSKALDLSELELGEGYVFPTQTEQSIDANELREKLMSGSSSAENIHNNLGGESEIDLHIEALNTSTIEIPENESLSYQLGAFEKFLDDSIAKGIDEINIIHGVGAGKLRMEIHKILSQHENVSWYKDANKTKFGYGATRAKLI